jgi:hypothetical protein
MMRRAKVDRPDDTELVAMRLAFHCYMHGITKKFFDDLSVDEQIAVAADAGISLQGMVAAHMHIGLLELTES